MKIFLLLIAVYTLAANGKHIGTSQNSTQLNEEVESQTKDHKPTAVVKNIIQKPRIVVSFLTNTKALIPFNNETEPDIIPRVDPFQRFLQFFFSNFIRDLTQPLAREERSATTPSSSGGDKNDTLVCEKCETHGELCCERCRRLENTTATATSTAKTRATEGGKHTRHYFLSISGGTDKRATATNPLTTVIRSKRQEAAPATAEPAAPAAPGETEAPEVPEETLPPANEGVVSPNQSYSDTNYLFTVTLPVFIVFVLLMVGLCFCLRSNGFCCRLFLSDPTKVTVTTVVVKK